MFIIVKILLSVVTFIGLLINAIYRLITQTTFIAFENKGKEVYLQDRRLLHDMIVEDHKQNKIDEKEYFSLKSVMMSYLFNNRVYAFSFRGKELCIRLKLWQDIAMGRLGGYRHYFATKYCFSSLLRWAVCMGGSFSLRYYHISIIASVE